MLYQQTLEKINAMKLTGMAIALEEQRNNQSLAELSFEERLGMLVERQWLWRENRSLTTRLRSARLKIQACMENVDFRPSRGIDRNILDQMAAVDWVRKRRNCLITGPSGAGKTYLACALANQACRNGYRVAQYRASKLFREFATAKIDGSLPIFLKKLFKVQLLVVDDFGLDKAEPDDYRGLLEIIDDRYDACATIITSQFPVASWYELIGIPTVADALLDRLVHNAYRFELKGESLRKKQGLN